jgi:hypothetical protein
MQRHGEPVRDNAPLAVAEAGRVVHRIAHDRGIGGAHDDQRHLVGDRRERVLHHLHRDRIGVGAHGGHSRESWMLPAASTRAVQPGGTTRRWNRIPRRSAGRRACRRRRARRGSAPASRPGRGADRNRRCATLEPRRSPCAAAAAGSSFGFATRPFTRSLPRIRPLPPRRGGRRCAHARRRTLRPSRRDRPRTAPEARAPGRHSEDRRSARSTFPPRDTRRRRNPRAARARSRHRRLRFPAPRPRRAGAGMRGSTTGPLPPKASSAKSRGSRPR